MSEILYENAAGLFATVTFDVTVREAHEGVADLPRHPVEASADMNDHVRRQPRTLTLEVAVTNTPTRAPRSEVTGEPIAEVVGSQQEYDLSALAASLGRPLTDLRMRSGVNAKVNDGVSLPLPAGLGSNLGGGEPSVTGAVWEQDKPSWNASLFTVAPMDRVRDVFDQLDTLWGVQLVVLTSVRQYDSMALRRIGAPINTVGFCVFTLEFETYKQAETAELVPDPTEARAKPTLSKGSQVGYELPETQRSAGRSVTDTVSGWLQRDTVAVP